jgi:hypothetical protein
MLGSYATHSLFPYAHVRAKFTIGLMNYLKNLLLQAKERCRNEAVSGVLSASVFRDAAGDFHVLGH